jgi:hypothetical protein
MLGILLLHPIAEAIEATNIALSRFFLGYSPKSPQ